MHLIQRFAILSSLLACSAFASAQSGARAAIEKNYAAVASANKRGDVQAATQFYAPNFKATIAKDKVLDRDQMIAYVKGLFANFKVTTVTFHILSFSTHGKRASVTLMGNVVADQLKAPKHEIRATSERKDEWSQVAGSWRLESSIVTKPSMYIDGKLVRPKQ